MDRYNGRQMNRTVAVKRAIFLSALVLLAFLAAHAPAAEPGGRTFFVSVSSGKDDNTGLAPESAWRSLDQVNRAKLQPGDKILFKRGDSWRGQLIPQSGEEGAPITHGAYGEGEKPRLLGSVSRNEPPQWHDEGGNIWSTAS